MKVNELLSLKSNYTKKDKKTILSFLLNCSELDLLLMEEINDRKVIQKYKKIINKDLPVQYLLGTSNFFGNNFNINKDVLIPRPETEVLVEETDKLIKKYFDKKFNIIDIGTGSGIIAITLKLLNQEATVTATDISKKALKVAKINAEKMHTNVSFIRSDMLKNINGKYDVLISNPPYISTFDVEIETKVIKYEPNIALFALKNGLYYYEEILKNCHNILNKKNIIAFEIGNKQRVSLNKMIKNYFPKAIILNKKDLYHRDRYIFILNNCE